MKKRKKLTLGKILYKIFFVFSLIVLSTYVLLPLVNMAIASVKPLEDIQIITDSVIPKRFDFGTYSRMWKTVPLLKYIKNTFIVVSISTVCSVLISVFVGYVLNRFKFRGQKLFGNMLIFAQMLPGILFLLPLYMLYMLIMNKTGIQLAGTYQGLIITYMTFSLPFSIWMMRSYFQSIPVELDEAAYIDGCGQLRTLLQIILPVARPGIIGVTIYSFIVGWEEIMFASVLTSDRTQTISVGLRNYQSAQVVYWNEMMAATMTVTVPVVVMFMLFQKYLVQGLTAGSVKG